MVDNNYFGFAENDYQFFEQTYKMGIKGSAQASLGQSICERYLKHIIDEYANPEDEIESLKKQSALRTHSLHKLLRYIKEDMELTIPETAENKLARIDGFYFTTRYPGDDSFVASEKDIDDAWEAVQSARTFTTDVIRKMESDEPES